MSVCVYTLAWICQCWILVVCLLVGDGIHVAKCDDSSSYLPNSPHSNTLYTSSNGVLPKHVDTPTEHIPILLWWTERIYPYLSDNLMEIQCGSSRSKCYLTKNRAYMDDDRTRGLLFYGSDFDVEDLPLPRGRQQEWALLHEESPMNNYIFSHEIMIELFNHTSTFRRESDYPLSAQNIYSLEYLLKPSIASIAEKNEHRKNGLAPILYVQSHCGVASDRDEYVRELMKYVEVDSYGKCLNNKELPSELRDPVESMEKPEFLKFIGKYKFHLAFENALCNDYMTEKLFRPLRVGSVPIVRGSPHAKDWMPDGHSTILVDDFTSPEELAKYIKQLDRNNEEYEKYLQFKKVGITNQFLKDHVGQRTYSVQDQQGEESDVLPNKPTFIEGFQCHVCEKIAARLQNERAQVLDPSIPPLPTKNANSSHQGCPQPSRAIQGLPLTYVDAGMMYNMFSGNNEAE